MPEISRFPGIIIQCSITTDPPHFHAAYGEYKITVEINSGIVNGTFPKRALKAALEQSAGTMKPILRLNFYVKILKKKLLLISDQNDFLF